MTDPSDERTLHEVAEELGVHYMTAYRYVRLGMLPARKVGATWRVRAADVKALGSSAGTGPAAADRTQPADARRWVDRLEARLLAGDGTGAWSLLEAAMTSGMAVDEVYLDVLSPALVSIGERWAQGVIDVADEHLASSIAVRLLGRLGPRFARPGRTRGSVVLGGPPGEAHSLPVSILADLAVGGGFEVVDLGADVPVGSFVHAARQASRLLAVGISVTAPNLDAAVKTVVGAVHRDVPGVPVIVGGGAVVDERHARRLGADGYASDGRSFVALLQELPAPGRAGGAGSAAGAPDPPAARRSPILVREDDSPLR